MYANVDPLLADARRVAPAAQLNTAAAIAKPIATAFQRDRECLCASARLRQPIPRLLPDA
jgi:hypothetical protein